MANIILLSILYAWFIPKNAVHIFLTENLDLDNLGDFHVVVSLAAICSVIFLPGGDSDLSRFFPIYLENKDYTKRKSYIVYYLKLTLIISFCFCVFSLLADFFLVYYQFEKLLHESYFAMILTPALAVFAILSESLIAIHRQYASSLTTELLKRLLFLASVSIWLFFNTTINEYQVIILLFLNLSIIKNWLYLILIGTAVNSVLQLASPLLRLSGYARETSIISNRILMISVISAPVMIYFFRS